MSVAGAGQGATGQGATTRESAILRLRVVSPEEATARLPMVERIVRDFLAEWKRRNEAEEELLRTRRTVENARAQRAEGEIEARIERLEAELLGVDAMIDDPLEGSVVFHGQLDGRDLCLSWQPQEPRVAHWYETGETPANRRAL